MLAAAQTIKFNRRVRGPGTSIYFLSGRKYWYQTVFCFLSLQLVSDHPLTPVVIDDGSIDAETEANFRRAIPWIEIEKLSAIEARLDRVLPESAYPAIRSWRRRQPLTRKLIDLHSGAPGWKLLLDSDMLFFRKPNWLLDWLAAPDKPAYMVDCVQSYGYPEELRARIGNKRVFPDRANIGIFGWKSDETDFDWLEYALNAFEYEAGPAYNITQAITSILFADRTCAIAPERDYIVLPSLAEGRAPTAILHHYVAESKRSYFQHGWRIVADRLAESRSCDQAA